MTPFDTLDDFLWATGAVFWAIQAFVVLGIAVHILHGLACAISLTLFCARALRAGGHPAPRWRAVLAGFRRWWELIGHHNNGSNKIVLMSGAAWRGPFDFDKV